MKAGPVTGAPAPFRRGDPRPGRASRRGARRAGPHRVRGAPRRAGRRDGEQPERLVEAALVVGEGARDDELVEQDAVGVEPRRTRCRRRPARACRPARAAPVRPPSPVALPEHSSTTSTASSTTSPGSAMLGTTRSAGCDDRGRADLGGQRLAGLGRLRAADVVDAERPQGGDGQGADRSGAEHEHPIARRRRTLVDPVQRDGERLGERGGSRVEAVGHGEELVARRAACRWRRRPAPARCPGCRARRRATVDRPGTWGRSPQRALGPPTTTSPGCQRATPSPTAATRPIHSWPCQLPGVPQPSSTMWRSLPHTPHRSISTSTSSIASVGTGHRPRPPGGRALQHGRRHVSRAGPPRGRSVPDTSVRCRVPAARRGGTRHGGRARRG